MRRSAADWDEDYVLSLPQGEHDWFERKGSKLLDLNAGAKEGHVRSELGKQLSAFANFGGGQIIYGVTDVGEIDNGGVSQSVRHGTKEWLEDIIPNLTEFEVVGVNVYPIFSTSSTSKIEQGKAVYVIDVPDSDRAPHQASDAKVYYVRSGGKSRPASHRLVEDIRNRAKHPNVDVSIELGEFRMHLDPRQPSIRGKASLPLTIRATNICPLKSQNTCLCLKLEGIPVDTNQHLPEFQRRYLGRKNDETFWEALHPLYPGMDVSVPQIHNLECVQVFRPVRGHFGAFPEL
jgi:hypothetical protein